MLHYRCHINRPANIIVECLSVMMLRCKTFHHLFYKVHVRSVQNDLILKYVMVRTPCRYHNRKGKFEREVSNCYFIPTHRNGITSQTHVCQKLFLSSRCLKKDRVQLLCKRFLLNGDKDDEKRGGDRRSQKFADKKEAVRHFIEREFLKRKEILTLEEYIEAISKKATVSNLGDDCTVYDFKNKANYIFKKTTDWHFKFNECKRFINTLSVKNKVLLLRGEPAYQMNIGVGKSVLKSGKALSKNLGIDSIPKGKLVNSMKL